MHKFEIEIKSLLNGKSYADALIAKMQAKDPSLKILGVHKQLNHYFIGGNLQSLYDKVQGLLDAESQQKLLDLSKIAKNFSVRTRDADGKIILVIKATVDNTTSENGIARIEFESLIPAQLVLDYDLGAGIHTIDDLDKLILNSGFEYQSKWSRERNEYNYKGLYVTIDKNAGYGYLAEFEKVIEDESQASETKENIRKMIAELDVLELPQDRLERMFKYYNEHWQEYYGTDKIFNIE